MIELIEDPRDDEEILIRAPTKVHTQLAPMNHTSPMKGYRSAYPSPPRTTQEPDGIILENPDIGDTTAVAIESHSQTPSSSKRQIAAKQEVEALMDK